MALEYPFELPATVFDSIGMPTTTQIDEETLARYARVLMIVAGADGVLSIWERGWLRAYLAAYGASAALLARLDDFDYKQAKLNDDLKFLLEGPMARWVRRSLLQGAIRMSRADRVADEEAFVIQRVGAMLGLSEDAVAEVVSLTEIFDSVTGTNTVLLSIAQKEDAEQSLGALEVGLEAWDAEPLASSDDDVFAQTVKAFAHGLLYVAAADGDISQQEKDFFRAYMRTWGVPDSQIDTLLATDPSALTAEGVAGDVDGLGWGLRALTTVALRTAGADGLDAAEERAILELYQLSGYSVMGYYALKGLEEVRTLALSRLNKIFANHLGY